MPSLPQPVSAARRAVGAVLDPEGLTLVGCSGGPDSLALAAAAAHHHRRGDARVGAVVVDHGLHPDSARIAATAAEQLRGLELDPVLVRTVAVDDAGRGPEAEARTARYAAFAEVLAETGASRLLLGHTRDDQAEQVLLGLARGSGTRALAGIPAARGPYRRPLLELTRADVETICAHADLRPWHDPSNEDPRLLRSRVRTEILPFLAERLSGSIRESLARTAAIAAEDAAHLESEARETFARLLEDPDDAGRLRLDMAALDAEPPAIRRRVLALAVVAVGGENPSAERIAAVEGLLARSGSAGPVQLAGGVVARRGTHDSHEYGKLVLVPRDPAPEP
ncbi:tRNA lysidine(34) synthetase TilS [Nesterenkonia halobia]|uniref:tRNA(Ile)-lysidine synthase n=1 Tax=Nesterenkonia halobia TaxID=37922 RepID=A0ABP6R982_9MICC